MGRRTSLSGGSAPPSALTGMDLVTIIGGEGTGPIIPPFSNDIAPTTINADVATWVDPTPSGRRVVITQSGIYLVNATVLTPGDLTGETGIAQIYPDWGNNTDVRALGPTLIDLANGGSGTLTFLFVVDHDSQGSFGIGLFLPAGLPTRDWLWRGQVVRLGGFA